MEDSLKNLSPNEKRIKESEIKLAERKNKVIELTQTFLNYLLLVEHPMNNFDEMEPRLFEQNIQVGVIQVIKD